MSKKLVAQGLNGTLPRMWRNHDLRSHYDVVIIGGGAHGLACAYYLAHAHGIRNVAVLEKSYIGAGGSGRNTTIIRSRFTSARRRIVRTAASVCASVRCPRWLNITLKSSVSDISL